MDEEHRLNPNQMSNRIRQIAGFLDGIVREQQIEMLSKAGAMEVLRKSGLMPKEDGSVQSPEDDSSLTLDAKRQNVLDGLYRRAKSGDAQAARAFDDLAARKKAENAFNVRFRYVPYEIEDKSIPRIVMDADEPVVTDIITAFAERSKLDGCPERLVAQIHELLVGWLDWAKVGLKPRKTEDDAGL